MDCTDGDDGGSQTAESSGPPREPYQVDGHLKGKEGSHAEEAGAQKPDLRKRAGVKLPLPQAISGRVRNDALRMKLNPASSESHGRTEDNKYPIQKSHDLRFTAALRRKFRTNELTFLVCGEAAPGAIPQWSLYLVVYRRERAELGAYHRLSCPASATILIRGPLELISYGCDYLG
jgi:hypothetical protein